VLTCNCPCGSNKQLGLWGTEKWEHLPFHVIACQSAFDTNTLVSFFRNRLTDRHSEPPAPPPKLIILS
jgi:hypothetical protein